MQFPLVSVPGSATLSEVEKREEPTIANSDNAPFANEKALIFGGGKGIGKAVALEWARRGAAVAVADIDGDAAAETAAEIEGFGGRAIALHADVTRESSIAEAVARGDSELGEIGMVMNNVGAILNGHPGDIPMAEWQRIIDLNYFAIVRSNAIFLPRMEARGCGHIVNTASFAGLYPYAAGRIPYASAKAAVISMTENLALLLEPKGIRVSCLIPGPTVTNIADTMRNWTPDLPMYAGGSQFTLKMPAELAVILADGMRDGRILIPAEDAVWEVQRRRAEDPDGFIREKIAAFARGDYGAPSIPDEIRAALAARQA